MFTRVFHANDYQATDCDVQQKQGAIHLLGNRNRQEVLSIVAVVD
jgi:hypothetical protein